MRPLIAISACLTESAGHVVHQAGDKYVQAVLGGAGGTPMVLPALTEGHDWDELLARIDGLLLTGSVSNVEPRHYDGPESAPGTPHDPARDATTLSLIPAAIQAGVPLLAICRGLQEVNVALGGTLHQRVVEVPGRFDHHPDPTLPIEEQYAPAHPVRLAPGGLLASLFDAEEIIVNSLHFQGINRLAPRLTVEATAADGQIEAVRVADAPAMALALQWHPEWRWRENPQSRAIFSAFGEATRERAERRTGRPEARQTRTPAAVSG